VAFVDGALAHQGVHHRRSEQLGHLLELGSRFRVQNWPPRSGGLHALRAPPEVGRRAALAPACSRAAPSARPPPRPRSCRPSPAGGERSA
jgi:hypothetical protein